MKTLFKTLGMLGLFFFLLVNVGWSYTTGDMCIYYTTGSPTWSDASKWKIYNGSGWSNANRLPTASDNVVSWLAAPKNYIVDCNAVCKDFTISNSSLTINSGYSLTVANATLGYTVSNSGTFTFTNSCTITSPFTNYGTFVVNNGSGDYDCSINSNFINSGTITINNDAIIRFQAAGMYVHNYTSSAGTIPRAIWNDGSTCQITNSLNLAPGGLGQDFYHFIWNCSNQSADVNLNSGLYMVKGTLNIKNTNNYILYLTSDADLNLTVGEDLKIGDATGMTYGKLSFTSSTASSKSYILNIAREFNVNPSYGDFAHNNANSILLVNFNGVNAKYNISQYAWFYYINWEVASSGSLKLLSTINICPERYFYVYGILECDDKIVNGDDGMDIYGSFELKNNATLKTANINGISASGTPSGSIQTLNRSFSTSANYEFNYIINSIIQNTGNGLPTTVNNLTISTASLGVKLSDNVTVNGALTLNLGQLLLDNKTLTVNGTIENIDAVITGDASNSSLVIGGGVTPLVTTLGRATNPLAVNVKNFTLNRANGFTLNTGTDLTVTNTLSLTSGLLSANGNTVTLGTSSVAGTLTSRTDATTPANGNISGKFKRYLQDGVSSYDYYIGPTAGRHLDANLTFTNSPTLTGKYITSEWIPNITVYGPGTIYDPSTSNKPINSCSIAGAWEFTKDPTLSGFLYNMNLRACNVSNYFGTLSTDAAKYKEIRIIRRENGTSVFDLNIPGEHADAEYTSGLCAYNAKRNNLSSFSQYTIGGASADGNSGNGPLPVTLQSLTSNVNGKNIQLIWKTSIEVNNAGFDIERKTIDGNWSKVGFVTGNGTRNTPTNYSYTDRNLNTGKYNYRLKQIDNNGNFEYHNLSGTVEVGVPKNYDLSQNYPNPFNPTTKIDFSLPFDSKVNLIIYDLTGREVKTLVNESRQAGYHTVEMNASMLSSGTYFFRIIANANGKDFISTKKMVLVK